MRFVLLCPSYMPIPVRLITISIVTSLPAEFSDWESMKASFHVHLTMCWAEALHRAAPPQAQPD